MVSQAVEALRAEVERAGAGEVAKRLGTRPVTVKALLSGVGHPRGPTIQRCWDVYGIRPEHWFHNPPSVVSA